ncbi:MAG TPA: helix-turn-helix transcriptional regulator, partial [Jiangellaceae bacterium]
MDPGALIRQARHAAGLTQRELARRAGVTRTALSHYERGRRMPTIAALRAVLAATGQQVRAELERLDADVERAIAAAAAQPTADRDGVFGWVQINRIAEVAHRVEGMAAASVFGAPVLVTTFELALADEDATFRWLAEVMTSWTARIRVPAWDYLEVVQRPPESLRELITRECPDARFWLRSGFTDARVRLAPAEVVARHVLVESPHGSIPVQPLHEIDTVDPEVGRVLEIMRRHQGRILGSARAGTDDR